MRLKKSKPDSTIRVTVTDAATGKSKARTYYDTTVTGIFDIIEKAADDYGQDADAPTADND